MSTTLMESSVLLQPTKDLSGGIQDLIHDLRQPLSTIESIAYYLETTLPPGQEHARKLLAHLREVIEESNAIMTEAIRKHPVI